MTNLKDLLDKHYEIRNTTFELSLEKPDPLFALKQNLDSKHTSEIAVVCALLAYGNAKQILKTLLKLDFSILEDREAILSFNFPLYRFQSANDIRALFLALNQIIKEGGIEAIFMESYSKDSSVISGINAMIEKLREKCEMTKGLDFLIGRRSIKASASSPLKRWNMMLRWLVREDNIDLGLWREVKKSDLILPLDTHTFRLSKKLGLLDRKSYDLASAIMITNNLKSFCEDDPIKYDFALYRIGQEKIII